MKILPACALATFAIAAAAADRIVLPPETAAFRPGGGIELAQANCLICHSAEYVQTQPPMPRKFWEAEVKKMREKYAAPTPEEAVAALVEYLAATYGTLEPKKP